MALSFPTLLAGIFTRPFKACSFTFPAPISFFKEHPFKTSSSAASFWKIKYHTASGTSAEVSRVARWRHQGKRNAPLKICFLIWPGSRGRNWIAHRPPSLCCSPIAHDDEWAQSLLTPWEPGRATSTNWAEVQPPLEVRRDLLQSMQELFETCSHSLRGKRPKLLVRQ